MGTQDRGSQEKGILEDILDTCRGIWEPLRDTIGGCEKDMGVRGRGSWRGKQESEGGCRVESRVLSPNWCAGSGVGSCWSRVHNPEVPLQDAEVGAMWSMGAL